MASQALVQHAYKPILRVYLFPLTTCEECDGHGCDIEVFFDYDSGSYIPEPSGLQCIVCSGTGKVTQ